MLRHQKVFQNCQAGKQADVLEGTCDLGFLGDLEVGQTFEKVRLAIGAAHRDHAHRRFVETGNAVEDRGLACTVWSDQRGDITALCFKGEVVDGHQAAELHREMFDLEDRIASCIGCHSRRPGGHQP